MAFNVLDEHEQGEQVQKWLRENALSILIGIGLGLVLLFGWQQWRTHRAQHTLDAAVQYDALSADVTKKDYEAVKQIAANLKSDYADTPYAVLAAMREADVATEHNDNEERFLHWEVAFPGVWTDWESNEPKGGFDASTAELRGDALVAVSRKDDARAAYTDALTHLDANAPNRAFLEMKLNDLGVAEKKGS